MDTLRLTYLYGEWAIISTNPKTEREIVPNFESGLMRMCERAFNDIEIAVAITTGT